MTRMETFIFLFSCHSHIRLYSCPPERAASPARTESVRFGRGTGGYWYRV